MKMMPNLTELVALIKGSGEVASAVAHKLACSDLRVCLTETPSPQAVHRGTTLGALTTPAIPFFRISEYGLVNIRENRVVDLVVG